MKRILQKKKEKEKYVNEKEEERDSLTRGSGSLAGSDRKPRWRELAERPATDDSNKAFVLRTLNGLDRVGSGNSSDQSRVVGISVGTPGPRSATATGLTTASERRENNLNGFKDVDLDLKAKARIWR